MLLTDIDFCNDEKVTYLIYAAIQKCDFLGFISLDNFVVKLLTDECLNTEDENRQS